nr:MAG TPA: hypothetical protein [Caudoviricetes sp.]DAW85050.1 MAG TPA: hypothetical protein [Bacteriophage sp.]
MSKVVKGSNLSLESAVLGAVRSRHAAATASRWLQKGTAVCCRGRQCLYFEILMLAPLCATIDI